MKYWCAVSQNMAKIADVTRLTSNLNNQPFFFIDSLQLAKTRLRAIKKHAALTCNNFQSAFYTSFICFYFNGVRRSLRRGPF